MPGLRWMGEGYFQKMANPSPVLREATARCPLHKGRGQLRLGPRKAAAAVRKHFEGAQLEPHSARATLTLNDAPAPVSSAGRNRDAETFKMAQRTVGIVGLGIMGGAFAHNLVAGGWRVIGYDIDPKRRRAMARAGVEIAPTRQASPPMRRSSSPACPSPPRCTTTVAAIAAARVKPRVIVRGEHLHARRQDQGRARRSPRPAMCCSTARSAAPARRRAPRTSWSMRAATRKAIRKLKPMFAGVRARRARPRRVRQRQPHEIRREPPGRHQQRGERGGHGARHQGRARRRRPCSRWSDRAPAIRACSNCARP